MTSLQILAITISPILFVNGVFAIGIFGWYLGQIFKVGFSIEYLIYSGMALLYLFAIYGFYMIAFGKAED